MITYNELIKKYDSKLKAIAYKLSKYNSKLDSEDLYQEELMYLWNEFNENKLSDKTDSYILQGCYFYLRNYMRKNIEFKKTVSLDQPNDNGDNLLESMNLVDSDSINYLNYLNDKLLAEVICNNGLTLKEKSLLPYLSKGLTVREIGRELGISHVYVLKMKETIRVKCLKHLDNN